MVFRLDELHWASAEGGWQSAVRSHLRDQRFATNLGSGIRATGEPRSCARAFNDICLLTESLCPRESRLRSLGINHEHSRRHPVRGTREQCHSNAPWGNQIEHLPDEDLQIGVLLALLQDDAKNQSSYLTWGEGVEREKVAATLRRDFLVTEERADKLSGAWGQHPLLGRMYLPAYRAGTDRVAQLRRTYPADRILPAIYGCSGLADIVTIDEMLESGQGTSAGENPM